MTKLCNYIISKTFKYRQDNLILKGKLRNADLLVAKYVDTLKKYMALVDKRNKTIEEKDFEINALLTQVERHEKVNSALMKYKGGVHNGAIDHLIEDLTKGVLFNGYDPIKEAEKYLEDGSNNEDNN